MKDSVKKMVLSFLILLPVLVLAQQEIEVPTEVTDMMNKTVEKFITGTFAISTGLVAAVQIIKKVMEKFRVEISGVKSQLLTILIAIIYSVIETGVWQDGNISGDDIVSIAQAAIAAASGVFGYKLLWRQPSASVKAPEAPKTEK